MEKRTRFSLTLLFIFVVFFASFSAVSAQKIARHGDDLLISHPVRTEGEPSAGISCSITVANPAQSVIVPYTSMINNATTQRHEYLLDGDLTENNIGNYCYELTCTDGSLDETKAFCFEITYTGKESPGTGFIVLFSILFIVVSAGIVYIIFYSIGRVVKFEMDILDVAYNLGFFFGLLALFVVFNSYWADPAIYGILRTVMTVTGTTNVFLPLVFFTISMIWGKVGDMNKLRGGRS